MRRPTPWRQVTVALQNINRYCEYILAISRLNIQARELTLLIKQEVEAALQLNRRPRNRR